MHLTLLTTPPLPAYELLDTGEAEKLERFGEIIIRRPDPQALWNKKKDKSIWENADAWFQSGNPKGMWKFKKELSHEWVISMADINFELRFPKSGSSFKHIGIFPEQYSNWTWIKKVIEKNKLTFETPSILNLFGYTGGATIASLQAGAKVTHVDASSGAIEWAKRNAEISGKERSVRWMVDDARKFVEKEIRRGVTYHAVILDPPSYGKGPHNEIWEIEKDFLDLIQSVKKVLHNEPLFVLMNGYSAGYSSLAYAENLSSLKEKYGGEIEAGELSIEDANGRHLPAGIFARWQK